MQPMATQMPMINNKYTPRELLEDWVEAKLSVASEYSINQVESAKEIVEEAKHYAEGLGVEWDDKIIPQDTWDAIETDREFWENIK